MGIIGKAATNYFYNRDSEGIELFIDGHPDGEMLPSVFFRSPNKLKTIEKVALDLCVGKTLDVGACAGNYSLELSKRGIDVTSLDISPLLCKLMRDRGVKHVVQDDILHFNSDQFDTILLMMNGFGIAREIKNLPQFLKHLHSLLRPGGQIIGDTTDIHYFESDSQIRGRISPPKNYVGDVSFRLQYKGEEENFKWVYPDPETLASCALEAGLQAEVVKKGRDFSFLMRLVKPPALKA